MRAKISFKIEVPDEVEAESWPNVDAYLNAIYGHWPMSSDNPLVDACKPVIMSDISFEECEQD